MSKNKRKPTTSTVEISISFRNLEDRDTFSKSDPMCVVSQRPPGANRWVPLLHTETIENDLDPDFATKLTLEYKFEKQQLLRFHVFDIDEDSTDLSSHDSLGYVEVSLGQIVAAGPSGYTTELSGLTKEYGKVPSTIILIAEELAQDSDKDVEVNLKLGGHSIGKWSGLLPPKTYFMISKKSTEPNSNKFLVIHRSKMCRGSNPIWQPLRITSRALCNEDFERELKIDVYQLTFSGALVHIGGLAGLSLNKIMSLTNPKETLPLSPPNDMNEKSSASISIVSCTVTPLHSFFEYIHATQVHCWFLIDFTCSNGDPADPLSLHYLGKEGAESKTPNLYEQAIRAVGNVLQDYNTTGIFKCYGFGARLPPEGELSFDFPINLTNSPDCTGIDGVLEAYRHCLTQIQLYGPTLFSPVIHLVADEARKSKNGENYYILVILTDGVITDTGATKKAIVDYSGLPMSILIIGLGDAEFDTMEKLDGDAIRLTYKKKEAQRDIVHFLAYRSARQWMNATGESTMIEEEKNERRNSKNAGKNGNLTELTQAEIEKRRMNRLAKSQLAQELLAEIPDHLTSYMRLKGIVPNMIPRKPKPAAQVQDKDKKTNNSNVSPPATNAAAGPA